VRAALASQSGLRERLIEPAPELVAAPLARPGLSAGHAEGLDLILEGFLLHHGTPRHLDLPEPGRRVLAGDYCYAHGLVWVAEAGDLAVIAMLADLVAMSAALVATGDRDGLVPLWRATLRAIAEPDPAFAARFGEAKDTLRRAADSGPLHALAQELPAAPGLAEALRA
jgi:hypothetical protein